MEQNKMESKIQDKVITAAEARNLSDTSASTLKLLYKHIREMALDGACNLVWNFSSISGKSLAAICDSFRANGYKLKLDTLDEEARDDFIFPERVSEFTDVMLTIMW